MKGGHTLIDEGVDITIILKCILKKFVLRGVDWFRLPHDRHHCIFFVNMPINAGCNGDKNFLIMDFSRT